MRIFLFFNINSHENLLDENNLAIDTQKCGSLFYNRLHYKIIGVFLSLEHRRWTLEKTFINRVLYVQS